MEQRGLLIQRPERPRSFPISSSTRQLHAEIELLTSFFFFFFLESAFLLTSIKSWQAGKVFLYNRPSGARRGLTTCIQHPSRCIQIRVGGFFQPVRAADLNTVRRTL